MSGTDRADHDVHALMRLLDRRQFLGASAVVAAGLALPGYARAGRSEPGSSSSSERYLTDATIDHRPYSLDVSSALCEDHFQLEIKTIDPAKDKVVTYMRPDGHHEALLLQDGFISQIYRDPKTVGGWNIREIASGVKDMVAGILEDQALHVFQLHLFYRTPSGDLRHLQEDAPSGGVSSGVFRLINSFSWGTTGLLQMTTNNDRQLLVFCASPGTGDSANAVLHYYYLDAGRVSAGSLSGFPLASQAYVPSAILSAYYSFDKGLLLLYVPRGANSPGVQVFSFEVGWTLNVSGNLRPINGRPIYSHGVFPHPAEQPANLGFVAVAVETVFEPTFGQLPVAIVADNVGKRHSLSALRDGSQWFTQTLTLPPETPGSGGYQLVPSIIATKPDENSSHQLASLFLLADGHMSVVRQVDQADPVNNAQNPIFNPAVPLQDRVGAVASQVRASDGDELIVVDASGQLEALARTVDDGWTATTIHTPATESAQVSAYRVQLTLSDDWSASVVDHELQITADGPAIALLDSGGVSLGSTPVTVKTDKSGQVMIPVVATGLYAPKLTITADGLPAPVTLAASDPVNGYMTGKAPLDYMPTLDAGGLTTASTDTGLVFPGASDHDTASKAMDTLSTAAKLGIDPNTPPPSGRAPVTLGSPNLTLHQVKVDGLALSFDALAHDAVYAMKKGAAKVKSVAIEWDKDAKAWVSKTIADFGAWVDQEVQIIIKGLKEAADLFHHVINKLGGLLEHVIKWIEVHVLALLGDAIKLAERYEDWMGKTTDSCADLITTGKQDAVQKIEYLRKRIHDDLQQVAAKLKGVSIDQLTTGNKPLAISSLAVSDQSTSGSASSGWLQQKVAQDNPPPAALNIDSAIRQLLDDMGEKIEAEGDDVKRAFNGFRDALFGLGNPKTFGSTAIDGLIDAFDALIDVVLDFVELVIDTLADLMVLAMAVLKSVLETALPRLPLVSGLLEAAGRDTSKPLTLGFLCGLLIAFPTVLAYKIRYLSFSKVPFASAAEATRRQDDQRRLTTGQPALSSASNKSDLALCRAFAATFDSASALFIGVLIAGVEEVPSFFEWGEIVTPVLISALDFPAHGEDLPFTSPVQLDDNGDILTAATWVLSATPAALNGVALYIAHKDGKEAGKTVQESTRYLTACCGALGMVFGALAAVYRHDENVPAAAVSVAAVVLDHTAPVLAWGLAPSIVEATEHISPLVWGIIGSITIAVAGVLNLIDEDVNALA